jgi:L-threonylcarbamoyladenylate synthase
MIEDVARIIIGGGVVVYPTETVYGLGASASNEQAILRVFKIKKRPLEKPIFLAVSSLDMLEKVADVSRSDLRLLDRLLPGPVSVLAKRRSTVPDVLTAMSPLVGIRFPDHEIALDIIDATGPITSTSANITGHPSPVSASEVSHEVAESADLVIDGGMCTYAKPSTLVDLASRRIIRPGAGNDRVNEVLRGIF